MISQIGLRKAILFDQMSTSVLFGVTDSIFYQNNEAREKKRVKF